MSEWQTIDSAPKNGTPVLVWFCGRMHVAEYTAVWHPDNLKWCVREAARGDGQPTTTVVDISQPTFPDGRPIPGGHAGPTHWMPLPAPPAALHGDRV